MKLRLNEIEVECVIGEREEERKRTQKITVGVELVIPDDAGESDKLTDTVDYAALCEKIRAALIAAKCQLVERAAWVVAEVCKRESKVCAVKVAVTKYDSVKGMASATAEVEFDNRT